MSELAFSSLLFPSVFHVVVQVTVVGISWVLSLACPKEGNHFVPRFLVVYENVVLGCRLDGDLAGSDILRIEVLYLCLLP